MKWRKENEKVVYRGKFRSMIEKSFEVPEKGTLVYEIPTESSYSTIMGITRENLCIVIKRFLPGPEIASLGFPGGHIDGDETSEESALRELREETGYTAEKIIFLKKIPHGAYSAGWEYCFLALGCTNGAKPMLEEQEVIETDLLPLNEVYDKLFSSTEERFEHVRCGCLGIEYLKKNGLWKE